MRDKFLSLKKDKQEQILKAIATEFIEHSYEDASTNRIVENAGVSKGSLFNYFENKDAMFQEIIKLALNYLKQNGIVEFNTKDFIERCNLMATHKLKIYDKYPYYIELLAKVHLDDFYNVDEDLKKQIVELSQQIINNLYSDIDYSLFRDDINNEDLIKIINYLYDGYTKDISAILKQENISTVNYNKWHEDHNKFLQNIKKIYYKREQ